MGKTIVLDPGHGQYGNAYCTKQGYYEGTQMFKLGHMMKKKLEASGFKVIITRTKVSDDPDLTTRGKTAGLNKADMFISLHSNAPAVNSPNDNIRGVNVYYSIQDQTRNKKFADALCANAAAAMGTKNRGSLTRIGNGGLDYYGVIRSSAASGCKTAFLIEHGFHTSPSDAAVLTSDEGLSKIADADCKTICDFFNENYKGAESGNSISVVPSTDIGSTKTYKVVIPLDKYMSAANAMSGDPSLSVGKLPIGTYYIYKVYEGAYNLTKTAGTAGAWVNPKQNVNTGTEDDKDDAEYTSEKYDVFRPIKRYANAKDATSMNNSKGTVKPGSYYVYKESDGMYNINTTAGKSGFWINPAQNIFENYVMYDKDGNLHTVKKGDTVVFRKGFTPVYGGDGGIIPLTVIASVNTLKTAAVTKFRKYSDYGFEVLLDLINSWVDVKYLEFYSAAIEIPDKDIPVVEEPSVETEKDDIKDAIKNPNIAGNPKYSGIIECIKSGLMSEFLYDVVKELSSDDATEGTDMDFEIILGKNIATKQQIVNFIKAKTPGFDPAIAEAFLTVSKKYGIRGDVAICQSIIETGWFRYEGGTAVTPDQHNYCGLGVTSLGIKGNSFATIEIGVEAQMQHLYAYACKKDLPKGTELYDPRFKYVTRGCAPRWVDLEGKWCAEGTGYGKKILSLWKQMVDID